MTAVVESLWLAYLGHSTSTTGALDLIGPKQVFKAENNPWVAPIADQFQLGISHVFDYVRSDVYKLWVIIKEWEVCTHHLGAIG